jgi:hypothetical protein
MKFARIELSSGGIAKTAILQEGKYHEIVGDIFEEWSFT